MPRSITKAVEALQSFRRSKQAKRRPSGHQFALADQVGFLNTGDWDAVCAKGSVFLQRAYLEAFEAHPPDNVQMRYALAYRDGRPRIAMVMQRAAIGWKRVPKKGDLGAFEKMGLPDEQMVVCGNLLAPGPGIAFAPGVDADESDWLAIGEALYRLRRGDKLLGESSIVMCKDFPADWANARAALRLLSYRTMETEPDMVLALDPAWRKPQDYLAAMTSGYRSNVNRLAKQLKAGGVDLEVIDADCVERHADTIHRLYLHVHDKQALRLATPAPGFAPALARALGKHFVCRVARLGERIVGFVTSLMGPDGEAHGYVIGYEPDANETLPIYLSLLQSTVDDAIAFGAQRLSLGRTALTPKANIGCLPQPMVCLIRHRVPTMNPLLSAVFRLVEPEQPPQRNPFKAKARRPRTDRPA